jgi:ankyrin repeat protein
LQDKLQQLSYTLEPFSEVEQVEFLKKFWLQTLNLEDTNQHRLQICAKTSIYAKALIRNLAQSISDKDKEFTGTPLQTHMLAEAFEEKFRSFYESEESEPELPHKLDLLGLYRRFVGSRYDIFYREKAKTPTGNVNAERIRDRDLKNMQVEHWRLALEALFTEDQVTLLPIYHLPKLLDEDLARIGIVQRNNEGKLQFIHRTIGEYFVADFLINELTKKTKQNAQVQEILLNEVLFKKDCHLIRAFLDALLENSKPSNEALKEYGEKLDQQWKEREEYGTMEGVTKVLHTAAKKDNAKIIGFLLDSLKSGGNLSTLKKLLLDKDSQGQTAWHNAAENDSLGALKNIWEWAEAVTTWQEGAERGHSDASDTTRASVEEEELQPYQLKKQLFLDKDKYGNTAWHGAAQSGSSKTLETLWSWANEAELKLSELLLVENEGRNTAWQLAAQTGHLKLLLKLGVRAKEAQLNSDELTDKLLLAKDQYGYTVWHRAAESGSLEALETLWNLGKESELKLDEIFLAQGKDGNTAWQIAAQRGHFKVLRKLWEWANGEQLDGNVLKDKLLPARNQYGYIAWHRAAERGILKALETERSWAKEAELNQDELKKKLFLAKDTQGENAWHLTAEKHPFEILEKLWVWSKEAHKNPDDLKKVMLLAKDQYGYTVWHRAAQKGNLEELETLWSWAKEAVVDADEFC